MSAKQCFNDANKKCEERITTVAAMGIVVLTIILSVAFTSSNASGDLSFNSDVRVNDDPIGVAEQSCSSIAVDDNGTAYIVWVDYNNGDIFFAKSTDGGASFTPSVRINNNESRGGNPSISVDKSGVIYVVWHHQGSIFFAKSINSGKSFSPNVKVDNITADGSSSFNPSIAIDDSNIYVAWYGRVQYQEWGDVYFGRSTDGGKSFSETLRVSDKSSAVTSHPSITTKNGKVFIVWVGGPNLGANIHFAMSTNGGISFDPNVNITDSGGMITSVDRCVGVDSSGNIYVVWSIEDIYVSKSIDGGLSFLPEVKVNDNGNAGNPSIAVDNNSNVYIAWQEFRNDRLDVYFDKSSDGGESFGTDIKVNDAWGVITYESRPTIGVDRNGEVYVVWQDNRNEGVDGGDIYFSTTNQPIFPVTLNIPTGITSNSLNLTWSQNTNLDFSRYEVHISTEQDFVPCFSTLVATITNSSITSYTVTNLTENTLYYFKIRLHNSGGLYTDSDQVHGKTLNAAPIAVTLNTPMEITSNSLILQWTQNTNTDFARYEVHMSVDANFTVTSSTLISIITNQTITSYNVTNLSKNETYYFKVRVYDINGLYADSNEVSEKTLEDEDIIIPDGNGGNLLSNIMNNLWMFLLLLLIVVILVVVISRYDPKKYRKIKENKDGTKDEKKL